MRAFDLIDSIDSAPDPQALHKQQVRYLRWAIVQTTAALGLIVLACLLFLVYTQVQGDVAWLQTQAAEIEGRLARLSTPAPEVQALRAEIERVDALSAALEAAQIPNDPAWPAAVAAIGAYDRRHITLVSLTQNGSQVVLTGRATDNEVVGAYAQALEGAPALASIEIQSLRQLPPAAATAQPSEPEQGETLPARTVEFVLSVVLAASGGAVQPGGSS